MYIYISPRYIMIRLFKTKRKILKPGTGKNSTLCTKEKIRMTENFFSEVIKANGLWSILSKKKKLCFICGKGGDTFFNPVILFGFINFLIYWLTSYFSTICLKDYMFSLNCLHIFVIIKKTQIAYFWTLSFTLIYMTT